MSAWHAAAPRPLFLQRPCLSAPWLTVVKAGEAPIPTIPCSPCNPCLPTATHLLLWFGGEQMHGGMYERETRRGDRDNGSCTASSESSAASIDRAGVENIQQRKADKENLQNGESETGWQGSKGPGAPKGNIKGQKPPPLSGTEGTAAEINTRSPLNLIRKAESARQAAVSGQGTSNERGSGEEDDSAEGRSATSQTPCTPVGGYASVLDSVRNEIMEAERVMAEVTSEFGVDESRSVSPDHQHASALLQCKPGCSRAPPPHTACTNRTRSRISAF